MPLNRRDALRLGAAAITALGQGLPMTARAAMLAGDPYDFGGTEIAIHPVNHASLVISLPGMIVYGDPVGPVAAYADLPAPDLILITHEHGDHYNAETLSGLVTDTTRLIVNPAVFAMLPEGLKSRAASLANGHTTSVGDLAIVALPAYNMTEGRMNYHRKGRDNGYVMSIGGARVYIAGDTEDTPEMRALANIDIAFLPMNLPYTMSIDQAADAVAAFTPKIVYPYHYKGSDTDAFKKLVVESGSGTKVVLYDWYS